MRTGEVLSRKNIHAKGLLHRAVHLLLFDRSGQILLQNRSSNVDHYPNMLSISLTGHVNAGESSMKAVRREIQEELGLDPVKMNLEFLFTFRRDAVIKRDYIDRQFNDVYISKHDFSLNDLKLEPTSEMVKEGASQVVPAYKREIEEVSYFLRSDLKV